MTDRDMFEQFATLHEMSVLKVGDAYSNDDTNYAWWIWQKALSNTPQADDVRKDAERYRHIRNLMGDVIANISVSYFAGVDFHTVTKPKELDDLVDQAIDKAME